MGKTQVVNILEKVKTLEGVDRMPKDACYHKVKARYRVFPSAYASGNKKMPKVGAANYGTGGKKKKKKEGFGWSLEHEKWRSCCYSGKAAI